MRVAATIALAVAMFLAAASVVFPEEKTMSLTITSTAFTANGAIPSLYTCEGKDISPPLTWSGAPPGAKSFALIVDDPDAPSGTFTHWVLFDVPKDAWSLAQGASGIGTAGKNDFGDAKYGGPCPPKGKGVHRYFFRVYALDVDKLGPSEGATRGDVESAMKGHVLAKGELMGTFGH